jgi:hypothetical protein
MNCVYWRKLSDLKCLKIKKNPSSPGGEAQCTSHPPQELKTLVRIPPGFKVFLKIS